MPLLYYARAMDRLQAAAIEEDEAVVQNLLTAAGFEIINPYRKQLEGMVDSDQLVENNSALISNVSVLLANLSREDYPYVGVWFEMAEANALHVPVLAWVGCTGYEQHHYLKAHCEFVEFDFNGIVEYLGRAHTAQGVAAQLNEAKAYYDAIADNYREAVKKIYIGGQDPQYAVERNQLAKRLTDWCSNKRVLELGCGDGEWTLSIAKSASQICCVDASERMIRHAENRLAAAGIHPEFVQCDFFDRALPLKGHDIIVAYFFLSFLPRTAQREILGRLREACDENAIMIFAESVRHPTFPSMGLDQVRLQTREFEGRRFVICKEAFSRAALRKRLNSAGFRIVDEMSPASWFSFCAVQVDRMSGAERPE